MAEVFVANGAKVVIAGAASSPNGRGTSKPEATHSSVPDQTTIANCDAGVTQDLPSLLRVDIIDTSL